MCGLEQILFATVLMLKLFAHSIEHVPTCHACDKDPNCLTALKDLDLHARPRQLDSDILHRFRKNVLEQSMSIGRMRKALDDGEINRLPAHPADH